MEKGSPTAEKKIADPKQPSRPMVIDKARRNSNGIIESTGALQYTAARAQEAADLAINARYPEFPTRITKRH